MRKFEIHDLDVAAFIQELNKCTGQVWLTTDEGDRINLMSAFCRVIGLMSILQGAKFGQATIECENIEDESRLFRLNLYGKVEDK